MKIMKKRVFWLFSVIMMIWWNFSGSRVVISYMLDFFFSLFYQIHITQALARISMRMLEIRREKNVLLLKLNSTLFFEKKLKHIFIVGSFQGILMNVWYDNGFHDGDIL